jgi:hypothetical protein
VAYTKMPQKTSVSSARIPADTARMQSPGFFIKQIVIFSSLSLNFLNKITAKYLLLRGGDENFKWPLGN